MLIDLGPLTQSPQGLRCRLDGNGFSAGRLTDPQAASARLATHLRFLYLDGQFTALEDRRANPANLDGAQQLEIFLDELAPG